MSEIDKTDKELEQTINKVVEAQGKIMEKALDQVLAKTKLEATLAKAEKSFIDVTSGEAEKFQNGEVCPEPSTAAQKVVMQILKKGLSCYPVYPKYPKYPTKTYDTWADSWHEADLKCFDTSNKEAPNAAPPTPGAGTPPDGSVLTTETLKKGIEALKVAAGQFGSESVFSTIMYKDNGEMVDVSGLKQNPPYFYWKYEPLKGGFTGSISSINVVKYLLKTLAEYTFPWCRLFCTTCLKPSETKQWKSIKNKFLSCCYGSGDAIRCPYCFTYYCSTRFEELKDATQRHFKIGKYKPKTPSIGQYADYVSFSDIGLDKKLPELQTIYYAKPALSILKNQIPWPKSSGKSIPLPKSSKEPIKFYSYLLEQEGGVNSQPEQNKTVGFTATEPTTTYGVGLS